MKKFAFILFICAAAAACHKKEDGVGGSGGVVAGSAVIDAQVMHHYWAVPHCTVYIKSNCTTFPGRNPALYDSHQVADNSGFVEFTKLANGSYYLYAIGYDANVADTVWGYNSVTVNNKPGENKDYNVTVPVSE